MDSTQKEASAPRASVLLSLFLCLLWFCDFVFCILYFVFNCFDVLDVCFSLFFCLRRLLFATDRLTSLSFSPFYGLVFSFSLVAFCISHFAFFLPFFCIFLCPLFSFRFCLSLISLSLCFSLMNGKDQKTKDPQKTKRPPFPPPPPPLWRWWRGVCGT